MRNLPPLIALEPPPLPQRRRLGTDGSFEPVGVSEVLGEPELIANRFDFDTVEVEELQADEFPRNCLSAFFGKAYLIPLVIVETLGNFVVIALWFVYV